MVVTANQTTPFFTEPGQMALPVNTRLAIAQEGLEDLDDLVEFDGESLNQITKNLRSPGGRVPDPDPNADVGSMIPTPSVVFGAKSQLRIKAAFDIARYYETNGHALSVSNMRWNPVIKTFAEHWKSLTARKNAADPEVPKISKTVHIMKWNEAFSDFARRVIGTRTIPLSYVIRDTVDVPHDAPALMPNQPSAAEYELVEEEIMARATHTHPLYRDDNASL